MQVGGQAASVGRPEILCTDRPKPVHQTFRSRPPASGIPTPGALKPYTSLANPYTGCSEAIHRPVNPVHQLGNPVNRVP
jgi:hypothetical protein